MSEAVIMLNTSIIIFIFFNIKTFFQVRVMLFECSTKFTSVTLYGKMKHMKGISISHLTSNKYFSVQEIICNIIVLILKGKNVILLEVFYCLFHILSST